MISIFCQVSKLGKSIYVAGKLGSAGLPPSVNAIQDGKGDAKFTVINNAGALKLAELDE